MFRLAADKAGAESTTITEEHLTITAVCFILYYTGYETPTKKNLRQQSS
jgi:hypothetical protein